MTVLGKQSTQRMPKHKFKQKITVRMSKKKPVLKRSLGHSSSKNSSGKWAALLAVALITLLTWSLYQAAFSQSKLISQNKLSAESPSLKKSDVPVPSPRDARAISASLPKPASVAPQSLVLEKDSTTYPGQAPRLERKVPARPKPVSPQTIDWSKPSIAFVIDDIGHEITYDRVMDKLGYKITYAILPHLRYTRFYCEKSKHTGADVILHLPLESELGIYPGPGLITNTMPASEVLKHIRENLNSVPYHIGANNHMGSLGTSDPRLMQIILPEFKRRGLFFLDSYTSTRSLVVPIAHDLHIPVLRRDVFLDNVEEREPIRKQIRQTAQVALKSGFAIAIGHYKKHTLEVIAEEIPKLEKEGFQIVKLSDLMKHYA